MTSRRKTWQTILLYVFIVVLCVVILYPYFVMFITALKDNKEMYAVDHIFPNTWQWSNFADIWTAAPVFKYLINSMIIAGGATVLAILCGIPAAYALARMRFKGKGIFMGAGMMVNINLNNTILGLILLNAAFNQAFAIWLLRGTFMGISPEMEQAAKIDGCGTVKALVRVLLPMALPGIITTLIFVFINAWNEYTIALTLISTDIFKPITVGINVFYGFNFIQWQYLFATSLFATIPVVILFLIIEKHLVAGLTSGGVKG